MVDWVDVLRRLLHVYNVRTQAELGMAMGAEIRIGMGDIQNAGIPWKILQRAVQDRQVSWNWLLTGEEQMRHGKQRHHDDTEMVNPPQPPAESSAEEAFNAEKQQANREPPRIETRELARRLLYSDNENEGSGENAGDGGAGDSPANAAPEAPDDKRPDGGEGQGGDEQREAGKKPDSVVQKLEDIKKNMMKEIDRVEQLIEKRR